MDLNEGTKRKNNITTDADRERVCHFHNSGKLPKEISEILNIKHTTVLAIVKKYREKGNVAKEKRGNPSKSKVSEEAQEFIKRWLDEDCCLSLKDIKIKLYNECNLLVSTATIQRSIKGFNFSFKRTSRIPERRNCSSTISIRKTYALEYMAHLAAMPEANIIFIDEVGFSVSMRSGYGRALVGRPAVQRVPYLRSRNISICCAINKHEIVAYSSQPFPFNTDSFVTFLEELFDRLAQKNITTGVLVMDNVRFHHSVRVKELIEAQVGFKILFLPPYSPFLNPIENMFSKWKNIVKRGNPVNEEMLIDMIDNGSDMITRTDCENYSRNLFNYLPRCQNEEVIED